MLTSRTSARQISRGCTASSSHATHSRIVPFGGTLIYYYCYGDLKWNSISWVSCKLAGEQGAGRKKEPTLHPAVTSIVLRSPHIFLLIWHVAQKQRGSAVDDGSSSCSYPRPLRQSQIGGCLLPPVAGLTLTVEVRAQSHPKQPS